MAWTSYHFYSNWLLYWGKGLTDLEIYLNSIYKKVLDEVANLKSKYLIFDFDGTIADSFLFSVDTTNRLAPLWGLKPLKYSDIDELRSLSLWQMIRSTGIPFWKIAKVGLMIQKEIHKDMASIPMYPGLKEVIMDLKSQGFRVVLLSSNTEENVLKFLQINDFEIFEQVRGGVSFWGKSRAIKRLVKDLGITKSEAIYIGDESRDIKACRRAGVKIASVTWGFNSKAHLEAHKPDLLIETVDELYKVTNLFYN